LGWLLLGGVGQRLGNVPVDHETDIVERNGRCQQSFHQLQNGIWPILC
jgi:hypothetical protein